jgi:hypothetical protein
VQHDNDHDIDTNSGIEGQRPRAGSPAIGRRGLLRGAGAALAVAGGAVVATTVTAGPAQAAANDPLTLGAANSADAATTGLTSASATDATLTLENTSTQAPLRLVPSGDDAFNAQDLQAGSLLNHGGDLHYAYVDGGATFPALVFNEVTALQLVAIQPVRMLDTRSPAGRDNVVSGALDSQGRLLGGHWLVLDLTTLAFFFDSVVGNLTAVAPTNNGYVGVAPKPLAGPAQTSTINYVRGVTLANGLTAAVDPDTGTLAIYTTATTHLILDVNALNTPGPDWVSAAPPGGAVVTAHARAVARSRALARGAARMQAARKG